MSAVAHILRAASQVAWWFAVGICAALAVGAIQGCSGPVAAKPILTGTCAAARVTCGLINSACSAYEGSAGGEAP